MPCVGCKGSGDPLEHYIGCTLVHGCDMGCKQYKGRSLWQWTLSVEMWCLWISLLYCCIIKVACINSYQCDLYTHTHTHTCIHTHHTHTTHTHTTHTTHIRTHARTPHTHKQAQTLCMFSHVCLCAHVHAFTQSDM